MQKAVIILIAITLLACNNQKINKEITAVSYHSDILKLYKPLPFKWKIT
jgi:hypothetical protein